MNKNLASYFHVIQEHIRTRDIRVVRNVLRINSYVSQFVFFFLRKKTSSLQFEFWMLIVQVNNFSAMSRPWQPILRDFHLACKMAFSLYHRLKVVLSRRLYSCQHHVEPTCMHRIDGGFVGLCSALAMFLNTDLMHYSTWWATSCFSPVAFPGRDGRGSSKS